MVIYVDGSARSNGSKDSVGGFGAVVIENGKVVDMYQKIGIKGVTNNEMELKAILYAMIKYGEQKPLVTVYSDSAYSVNTLTTWMYNWARNDWKKGDKRTPENLDLIKTYYQLEKKGYKINLRLCKGHDGNEWNDLADKLATGKQII